MIFNGALDQVPYVKAQYSRDTITFGNGISVCYYQALAYLFAYELLCYSVTSPIYNQMIQSIAMNMNCYHNTVFALSVGECFDCDPSYQIGLVRSMQRQFNRFSEVCVGPVRW